MKTKGKVFKYGDNVDTDVIIPARYLNSSDPEELAKHCMEGIDSKFVKEVRKGDIIVAKRNFGCGSSREHAPLALMACGISCVIALSFARLFFRNAVNVGLPIMECQEAVHHIENSNEVEIDFSTGIIHNLTKKKRYYIQPFPEFIQEIIKSKGLIQYIKNNLSKDSGGKGESR